MDKLKLSNIVPDINQPRKYFGVEKMATLKDSINKHGVMNPLVVQKEGNNYLLIDGERRYRAAKELGLIEVPVIMVSPKNAFTRLIEQFHIQEQHESWSSSEKAMAIMDIATISKKPIAEVCELLSIDNSTVANYLAFAKLQHKEKFMDAQVSVKNAQKIQGIKSYAKKVKEHFMDEPFTKADESKIEKVLINKLKDKEITKPGDYAKIRDSFRSNPKLIKKFMEGDFDISTQFVSSNAKSSYALRNLLINGNYFNSHVVEFINNPQVAMTEEEIKMVERVEHTAAKLLKLVK